MDTPAPTPWTTDPGLHVVLSSAPPDSAEALAMALVSSGAAACVNLVPGVRSIYRWAGAVSNDPETLLLIKTPTRALPALRAALDGLHSYEIPEIVALGVTGASEAYAQWASDAVPEAVETRPNDQTT